MSYRELQNLKLKQGESWNNFQLRADKLLSRVNDSNFITVTDEQYSTYLRGAVEHDPVFAIAVRESELNDESLEETKCTLNIAYQRAQAKSFRQQAMTAFKPKDKAMLSSDVNIDSQPTSNELNVRQRAKIREIKTFRVWLRH